MKSDNNLNKDFSEILSNIFRCWLVGRSVANLINNLRGLSCNMGNFQVRYVSRVVIYERKMFIRLASALPNSALILFVNHK